MRKLTARQLRILQQLGEGLSVQDISNFSMLNETTIRGHLHRILKKTRCRSVFQLGMWTQRNAEALRETAMAKSTDKVRQVCASI